MSKVISMERYKIAKANKEAAVDPIGYEYFKNDRAVTPKELQDKRVKGIWNRLKVEFGLTLLCLFAFSACAAEFGRVRIGTPDGVAVLVAGDKEKIRSNENIINVASVPDEEKAGVVKEQVGRRAQEDINAHTAGLVNWMMLKSAQTANKDYYSDSPRQVKFDASK